MPYYDIFWENIIKLGLYIFPIIEPYVIFVYKYIDSWYLKTPIIIEPITSSEWVNICSLVLISKKYQLIDTNIIQKDNDNNNNNNDIKKEYYSFYKTFYSNYNYSEEEEEEKKEEEEGHRVVTKEHLFIAKLKNNKYICKVCFTNHVKYMFDDIGQVEESDISLLYVEYSHPKMRTPICLPFSNHMIQPYNELFTPAFILRQLQTQTEYYYFDLNYTLIILDSNLKRTVLKSNQYILWQPNPDNYTIIQRR